jgi:hypothetical protein
MQVTKVVSFSSCLKMRNRRRVWSACVLLLLAWNWACAQDLTEPRATAANDSVGPIQELTIATNSVEEHRQFFVSGLGLHVEKLENDRYQSAQRQLWQLPKHYRWVEHRFQRLDSKSADRLEETPNIRVLQFAQSLAPVHQSWNALELGPMAIGFPNLAPIELDQKLRQLGFGAQSAMNQYEVPRPDGTTYPMRETIFNGPDFVKAVLVERGNGLPLAPIEPFSKLGGPGYVSMVVADSEKMASFLTKVLDYEVRSDRVFTTTGALGAPSGTQYRFMIFYAKGSRYGHLLSLEYQNAKAITPPHAPRLPQRGLVMLSMYTKDLAAVRQRAQQFGAPVSKPILINEAPKPYRAMVITAPNQMVFEIRERR